MSAAGGLAIGSGIGRAAAQTAKRIEKLAPELDAIISTCKGFGGPLGPTEGPLWWKEGGYLLFSDINASKRMKYTPGHHRVPGQDQPGQRPDPRPPGPSDRLRARDPAGHKRGAARPRRSDAASFASRIVPVSEAALRVAASLICAKPT
jgi:hypothetical protein